jgi:hypothetical protein
MQLKIQRSQRTSITNAVIFCLDIRADYSAEEQHNIQRYRLGAQSVYSSRAAQKHFATAEGHLDQTQTGTTGQRVGGLVKGAFSMALAHLQLNVTVGSLSKGHHIECKDLQELLEAEDTLRTACKNLTRFLEVANTFDGSELVVTYENGEEKVHVTENMPPLLTGPESTSTTADISQTGTFTEEPAYNLGVKVREIWSDVSNRRIIYAGGAIILIILLVRACS